MSISPHITYREATQSQTATRKGIPNTPGEGEVRAMRLLAERVFEPLRAAVGVPIFVSSFYRAPTLNQLIGGSPASQHCRGEAMDLDADVLGGTTNRVLFETIQRELDFDQLIWEFGDTSQPDWVHVSYTDRHPNRRQVLRAVRIGGKTHYLPWTAA